MSASKSCDRADSIQLGYVLLALRCLSVHLHAFERHTVRTVGFQIILYQEGDTVCLSTTYFTAAHVIQNLRTLQAVSIMHESIRLLTGICTRRKRHVKGSWLPIGRLQVTQDVANAGCWKRLPHQLSNWKLHFEPSSVLILNKAVNTRLVGNYAAPKCRGLRTWPLKTDCFSKYTSDSKTAAQISMFDSI